MLTMFRSVFFVYFVVVFLFLGSSNAIAAGNQPAVAIKKPVIGEGVKGSVVKHLNLTTIWNEMEASFRATRKFRVLSRNKKVLKAIRDEQKFSASEMSKGDAAISGQFDNANYLIIPTIQDFKFYRGHVVLPNFDDKYRRTDSGLLEVSAQMVDTTTGETVSTFYLKSSFSDKPKIVNSRVGKPSSTKFTHMAKKVSGKLADQFVDYLYPMKVVKLSGKEKLIINRGSDGGLKIGQILEVYSTGEEMFDEDTGASLGVDEEFAGKVKISRINPKVTIAKIMSEEGNAIKKGDILRRPQ